MKPLESLTIWTIYDHPDDFPDHIVMRRHYVYTGYTAPYFTAGLYPSIEAARADVPSHLVRFGRDRHDVPALVESWL